MCLVHSVHSIHFCWVNEWMKKTQAAVKDIHMETKYEYYSHLWDHQRWKCDCWNLMRAPGRRNSSWGTSVMYNYRSPQQIAWQSEVSQMPVFNPAMPLLRTEPSGGAAPVGQCLATPCGQWPIMLNSGELVQDTMTVLGNVMWAFT